MKQALNSLSLIILFSAFYICGTSQTNEANDILKGFHEPPNSAKPRVWWHWMNGNITKDGIAKDLAWMKRAGIGGFQNFDASLGTPQIVKDRLIFMTPEWKDAFQFTAKLADSLQLEMAIAGSPGWSESGGPWVKPEDGMKKIVWTETRITGGKTTRIILPKPPSVTGTFQNIPKQAEFGLNEPGKQPPSYSRDIAVIAYKVPDHDIPLSELNPVITSSGGNFSLTQLTDGDLAATNLLPADTVKGFAWIQFAFAQPQTIKAITIVGGGDKGPFGLYGEFKDTRSLEISDDGEHYRWICYIPAGNTLQQTLTIPHSTARYFRVTIKNPPPPFSFGAMFGAGTPVKPPAGTDIAELNLHTATQINRFEEKAAFSVASDLYSNATPATTDNILPGDVIDLTGKLKADNTLSWSPPAGNWNIMRFGYSLTGKTNGPASPEATGLEVDKLDPLAVRAYFETYLNQYKDATAGLMGNKGLRYMVTDSWEAGVQNWTNNMPQEFQKRRGYSLLPWMPVLAGHIIKSAEASEQFLWDYRKTLSELVAEYHYDSLTAILQKRGMKRYSESHEDRRAFIADGMEVKRKAAIPMSAMWTPSIMNGGNLTRFQADIRESASVAHIYGQNLVAAESLTALGAGGNAWSYSPENLKPTADLELASGLNRFVIHTSVHQPVDDKIPGLGLGPFGQWFNRHETWAEEASAWTSYLSRSSYLLQQGKFVADIIYYYGEDNNITSLFGNKLPDIPQGYEYDFVNADALLNLLSIRENRIVTPSGMQYRILALDSNSRYMTLNVLRKINGLVKAGGTVVGPEPVATPGLKDDGTEFNSIVNELWKNPDGVNVIGKGNLFGGKTIREVLDTLKITQDFEYDKTQTGTKLLYVHRKLPSMDIFWINNRNNRVEDLEASFRVSGKSVEIWHPETGKTEPASYAYKEGRTKVSLHLEPNDALFVIFKNGEAKASVSLAPHKETELTKLDGSWAVNFQKDRGAPAGITLEQLSSWTENPDPGVKYFSGTATYTKTITAPANWFSPKSQVWIDLGDVKNLAEVIVNGKSLGIVWKTPFRINATGALKPGSNAIQIKVTNLWVNRLIGDQQPGIQNKITYTTMPFYRADSPLLPSGLLGPVRILSAQ